jgi:hypothetical protein
MLERAMTASPLLVTTLMRGNQIRSFLIRLAQREGWEAAVYDDLRIIQQHLYTDWHRVEQAIRHFRSQIDALNEAGWREPEARAPEGV